MCTKLKQNGQILIPGDSAIVRTRKGEKIMKWGLDNGSGIQANARFESLNDWKKRGFKEVGILNVDAFYEKNTQFKFIKPGELGVIYNGDIFLLVTEMANEQVSKVHHRQPCMRNLIKLVA